MEMRDPRIICPMTGETSIRDRASAALRAAMTARDMEAVAALRTLLAEFANAEALPVHATAGAIEDAPALGATEVERRLLSDDDLIEMAVRERDELGQVEDAAQARGDAVEAGRWQRRRQVIADMLGH